MNTTTTIYNGSVPCGCGKPLTPLEALYGNECQRCRASRVAALVKSGMVRQD